MSYGSRWNNLPEVKGSCKKGFKMRNIAWMGTGGVVDMFFCPSDEEDLAHFLGNTNFTVHTVGMCSNVIIRDSAIRGVVIKLGREFENISCDGCTVTVGCASTLRDVSLFAMNSGISGFEFCVGIPGTVGGAIATNASAYGNRIHDLLCSVRAVNNYGEVCTLSPDDVAEINYKEDGFSRGWVFIEATFKGIPSDVESIKSTMKEITLKRSSSQPVHGKAMGYIFRNPGGDKEARVLIEEAGCKGMKFGNAVISEKHCNFFEDGGKATSGDLEDLGNKVISTVKGIFGKDLEWNIRFLGDRL